MNVNKYNKNNANNPHKPVYVLGIKANFGQFCLQLQQVFFVGLTIGLQRNVVPILAEVEFGVPSGSFTLLMAFIISFGFVTIALPIANICCSPPDSTDAN